MAVLDRNLWYLFILNMAVGFSSQIIQPLFPLYLESLNASEVQIGLVIGLSSIIATLFMLPSGLLVTRLEKKRMLLISVLLSLAPPFFIASMKNWILVTPLFIMFNVAFAFFIPARMSLIEEKTTASNRATLFGIMNLAWPIAGIIAPSLSGYIAENWGWGISFYLASGVLTLSLLPVILLDDKPPSIPDTITQEKETDELYSITRPSLTDYLPFFVLIFSLHFAMTMGQGNTNIALPLYLKNQISLAPSTIGLFFTASSALTLLTQIPSGWLADRYGRKRLVVLSLIPVPLLFFGWTLTTNWMILIVLYAVSFGLWSMTWPATIAVLSENIPKDLFSTGIGIRMTGARLGFTIGPLMGGYLYSSFSYTSPFIASGLCYAVAIMLALLLKEKRN